MADSVDSASSSRANSAATSTSDSAVSGGDACLAMFLRLQIEAQEYPVFVGKIANDAAQRRGQLLDQGGDGDDLFVFGEHGLLKDVDHQQFVAALEVLFADRAQIFHGLTRRWSGAGDVQAQLVAFRIRALGGALESGGRRSGFRHL